MSVPVVQIGIVPVRVVKRRMRVTVRVRFGARRPGRVRVLVVLVVPVQVLVLHQCVHMFVIVALTEM